MTTNQYEAVGNAVVGADGIANIIFQCPGPPMRRLSIDSIAILCTNSAALPTCTVYDGFVAVAGRVRDSTHIGDRNTFTGTNDVLFAGQAILVQWTAATPGANANAVLRGVAS